MSKYMGWNGEAATLLIRNLGSGENDESIYEFNFKSAEQKLHNGSRKKKK